MKGQGIIEAVYSVGILGLLLTGVVILILLSVASKKNDFDRKKATELGTLVIEDLINKSQNDATFWNLTEINDSNSNFSGYTYNVGFTNVTNNLAYPNCGVGKTDCAEVNVTVNWEGKNPQKMTFNRFFSKNAY